MKTIEVTDRAADILKGYREAGYIDDLKIRAFELLRLAFGECDAWIYDEQAKHAASLVFDMVSDVEELAKGKE